MINFTTEITEIRTQQVGDIPNVIKEVDWILTGTYGDFAFNVTFNMPFTTKITEPTPDLLVDYSTLSQSRILEIIEGTPQYIYIKQLIETQIQNAIAAHELESHQVAPAEEQP